MTAPDPNRSAGLAEAAIIRGHLQDEEADIARLRARQQIAHSAVHNAEVALEAAQQALATARAIAANVDRRVDELEAGVRTHRGFLHPIRRLPDEILAAILSEYNDLCGEPEYDDFTYHKASMAVPFRSAAVCRRWRSVAVQTRALWTYIVIDFKRAERRPSAWLALIMLIGARSVSHPVSISVRMPAYHAHNALEICTALLQSQLRWRTLHIVMEDGRDRHVQRLLTGHCPLLHTVAITGPAVEETPDPDPVQFALSGPRLHRLHISECRVSLSEQLLESSIEHVTMSQWMVSPRMSDLRALAERLPRLQTLSISSLAKYILDGPAPITFPELRSITLIGAVRGQTRQCFQCPRLVEATMFARLSRHSTIPSLLLSDLDCVSALQKLCLGEYFHSLDQSIALDLLRPLPQLQEFSLLCQLVHSSFFEALSQPSDDRMWIVPRLRRLTIQVPLSKTMIKAALTFVERRSEASRAGAASAPCLLSELTLGDLDDKKSGRTKVFQDAVRAALGLA